MKINYIDDAHTLAEICEELHACKWIAVDTEFLRQNTYYPELCLVQIQDCQNRTHLIDPIALPAEALQPLWALLADHQVTKVFHSARQDLEVLYQTSGIMLQNLFDTQIAALFLGYGENAGFARLVESMLHTQLEKTQTRTNWHHRPLTPEQLQYAADDVIYLAPLYETIQSQLTDEQQAALQEDFQSLLNPDLYTISPEAAGQKLLEGRHFSSKQMAIVQTLAAWREVHAQANNAPRKWILTDDLIYEIAKRPPKTIHDLYKFQNLKAPHIQQFGEEWIQRIDEVFAHPETWPPKPAKPPKLSKNQELLALLAQAWVHQIAHDYDIQVTRILNKPQLTELIKSACEQPPHSSTVLTGWRHLLVEKPIRSLCQNHACLSLNNGQLQLQNEKLT